MSNVSFEQQRRKAFEPPARDWETTRQAILEARGARESANVEGEVNPGPYLRLFEKTGEFIFGNGSKIAIEAPAEIRGEQTVVDALWEDQFGGVSDDA